MSDDSIRAILNDLVDRKVVVDVDREWSELLARTAREPADPHDGSGELAAAGGGQRLLAGRVVDGRQRHGLPGRRLLLRVAAVVVVVGAIAVSLTLAIRPETRPRPPIAATTGIRRPLSDRPSCNLCLPPITVMVWWYGGTNGNGFIVDPNRSDPRAVVKFKPTNAPETVQTDLYVLPMSAPVGGTTQDALSSAIRAKAIWDYAWAENEGSLASATVGGTTGLESVSLSWGLVTNGGETVPAGEYQLVVPVVVDGQPAGFSVADFQVSG